MNVFSVIRSDTPQGLNKFKSKQKKIAKTIEKLLFSSLLSLFSVTPTRFICLLNCGCPSNQLGGVTKETLRKMIKVGEIFMTEKVMS
jgi:hypothetical protein